VLGKDLVRSPAAWVTYLGFNMKKPPFTDKYVRIAFSQALDREGFVRDVLKGLGKPYRSWIPPGVPGYDETATVPGFDAKAAVQTLIDGGYGTADKKRVDCNKLGTVKLSYSNTPRNQALFQFLVGNLARVFACPILLDPIDPSTYPVMMRDPKTAPQIFLITWQEEYAHPQNWLFLQTCAGVYASRIGYCNKDFDAAFAAANQELDFDKAIEKYQAAQKIFVSDNAVAFLWNSENAYLIKPYVLGLWDHHGTGDNAWPGQFGPVLSYDIDTSRVGAGYPAQ
jgi:ABC-type oligopeptide transport system substrate-binding subunit